MASYNRHVTDRDSQVVERGREESGSRPQPMPAPVEALILFGYPPDLVLSTYRQLQSARATDAQHTTVDPGSGNAIRTGNALPHAVSAATLLAAMDDTVGDPDVSSSGTAGAGSGARTSPSPGGSVGTAQGLREDEGIMTSGEVVRGQTAEDVPSTAHGSPGPGHQMSASRLAPHATPSPNTSFINNQSSTHSQSSTHDHSSISNAEGAVSSSETSPCPLVSSAAQQSPEAASPWTSSRTAEVQEDSSPVTTSSSLVTASSVTVSCCVETSPASTAERSAGTAADPSQNTPPAPSPSSGSSSVSRDRSRDREEQNKAEADEEKVRERRRQLSRLRALRAENRRLKERQTCRHCGKKPVALTLLPCGHFCLCEDCGPSFEQCPVCRKTILADVKTFVC